MSRITLLTEKVDALRRDYIAGFGPHQTEHRQHVAQQTVRKYFARFESEGVVRGTPQPYAHKGSRHNDYVGPAWLGKALTVPPVPIGPDWIGKPA